ncbi:hypothetical protein DSY14_02985 [Nocardiopsis sp. MG754419]|nr:hypothetical protein [Nocardiopsis sp. MG754419]
MVAHRTILGFLAHANRAAGEPLVREAIRRCYATQVDIVQAMVDGDAEAARGWFGASMIDNMAAMLDLDEVDEPWAHVLGGRFS